jgi:hypothetical protein
MFTPEGPKSAYDDEADALWYAFKEAQDAKTGNSAIAAATVKMAQSIRMNARQIIERVRRR